jgi:hypothetical protein
MASMIAGVLGIDDRGRPSKFGELSAHTAEHLLALNGDRDHGLASPEPVALLCGKSFSMKTRR